ncbi:hypothetical protein G3570_00365 [Balneolaceae bacterium YR4-1]|uniref:Uncharacterized protein n=1 Tax=Halalkalibaculum roseum TaxID=2709311 RepID=A0A6M1SWZ6_9BACT|nr:DUF6544 family protein [Halalkalibaculum roseum]NGP75067.1 hypothetical protein [Halalkalibaculum roseum]
MVAKILFSFLLVLHGVIHFAGFFKAFEIGEFKELTGEMTRTAGLIWLSLGILFLVTTLLYLLQYPFWASVGLFSVVFSQILIFSAWSDAKFGTIANLILLVPILIAFMGQLPGSYENRFRAEVEKGLNQNAASELLTNEDIAHLPQPVQKYIRYTGAIGKEKLQNVRVIFRGDFKLKSDADFVDFRSVQYNFMHPPKRLFLIESALYGLPLTGLHSYVGATAAMQIRFAGLFQVVDAKGPEMNRSETVTLFNDLCYLAPAALIDKNIEWETIDSTTVNATFTNQGNTISATLYFNEKGELVNFSSEDRAESMDGESYTNYRWTTPLSDYRDYNGRKRASYGEAIWHKPEGDYVYAKIHLEQITYNADELSLFE